MYLWDGYGVNEQAADTNGGLIELGTDDNGLLNYGHNLSVYNNGPDVLFIRPNVTVAEILVATNATAIPAGQSYSFAMEQDYGVRRIETLAYKSAGTSTFTANFS
jgi:hypothetical protein